MLKFEIVTIAILNFVFVFLETHHSYKIIFTAFVITNLYYFVLIPNFNCLLNINQKDTFIQDGGRRHFDLT